MVKRFLIILFCILSGIELAGQNTRTAPNWVKGYFKELPNSYIETVSASGYDLQMARNNAYNEAMSRRSLATGTQATVKTQQKEIQVQASHDVIVKTRVLDEWTMHTRTGYTVYLLVQTAKNPTLDYEPVMVSEEYPFSAKVFVPGMAQFEKGSTLKGTLFLGGEIVCVGGIVVGSIMAQQCYNKGLASKDASVRKQYTNMANVWGTVRNVSIAGAVAVYAWNVIDGITAKGQKHVVTGRYAFSAAPYADYYSVGVSLAYRF